MSEIPEGPAMTRMIGLDIILQHTRKVSRGPQRYLHYSHISSYWKWHNQKLFFLNKIESRLCRFDESERVTSHEKCFDVLRKKTLSRSDSNAMGLVPLIHLKFVMQSKDFGDAQAFPAVVSSELNVSDALASAQRASAELGFFLNAYTIN